MSFLLDLFSILKAIGYILLCSFLIGCDAPSSLKVATSANMQFAMEEIAIAFEKEHRIKVELIVGSSGKLATQIEQGAPFDVFVAADMKYPQHLFELGLTEEESKIYGLGKLVLWTAKEFEPRLDLLTTGEINKIAIPNPKTAPYGVVAANTLKENGIFEDLKQKLVYGESVSQTNHFIISKAVDVGFSSLSIVLSKQMKGLGNWILVPANDIAQGVVVLKKTKYKNEARNFYNFLFTPKAQDILAKHGCSLTASE